MNGLPENFASRKFMWIDCVVYDRRLKRADKTLAYVISQYAAASTAKCWPSETTIADRVNLSVRHVQRCIARLIKYGWITAQKRGGGSNVYTLLQGNISAIHDQMQQAAARKQRATHDDSGVAQTHW